MLFFSVIQQIQTFLSCVSTDGNTDSLLQDLNLGSSIPFPVTTEVTLYTPLKAHEYRLIHRMMLRFLH